MGFNVESSAFDIGVGIAQIATGSPLEGASGILQSIRSTVAELSYNRKQCRLLYEDAERLLNALANSEKDHPLSEKSQEAIADLETVLNNIESTFRRWRKRSLIEFAKSSFDHGKAVESHQRELHRCFAAFELTQLVQVDNKMDVLLEAQTDDRTMTEDIFTKVTAIQEMCQTLLNVPMAGPALRDQMVAVQSIINSGTRTGEHKLFGSQEAKDEVMWFPEHKIDDDEWQKLEKFKGVSTRDWKPVVVHKIVKGDPEAYRRAKRQNEILKAIQYRHDMVPADFFEDESSAAIYIIIPFYQHGTIMEFLELATDPLSTDVTKWLSQVAGAVAFFHGLQDPILHRHIRGANIFIDDHGNTRLCNLLFAKHLLEDRKTSQASFSGDNSPSRVRWMPPEYFLNDRQEGTPTDVWSFGITAIEVLTGKRPFHDKRDYQVVAIYCKEGRMEFPKSYHWIPSPPTGFVELQQPNEKHVVNQVGYCSDGRRLDEAWASVIARCLEKEPEDRISMEGIVKELQCMRQDIMSN